MAPSIRTTLVGSYPLPDWLRLHPTAEALEDATAVVLHLQERAGVDLLTDGELSRFDPVHPETNGMIEYFVRPLEGVRSTITRSDLQAFRTSLPHLSFRRHPAGVVEGEIGEGTLDLIGAYQRVRALTRRPLKFTVTSPYMLARSLLDLHYRSLDGLGGAIADVLAGQVAEIDADVVQVDEANLPGRPEDAELAAELVNRVLDAVPGTPAVHVCFGNYGGQRIQPGRLHQLLPFFAALHADHVVLEVARPGIAEVEPLKELTNVRFGIGVIDIKSTEIESADTVARRIEAAAALLGSPERIAYVHPDCGFWMLARSIADGKIHSLVAGRDLYQQGGGQARPRPGPSHDEPARSDGTGR
jgi:5-methyltetrahydropteroyltriglutamate--homocysteine methyltransferase